MNIFENASTSLIRMVQIVIRRREIVNAAYRRRFGSLCCAIL